MSTNDPAGIAGTRYTSGAEALQALIDAKRQGAACIALRERAAALVRGLDRAVEEADRAESEAYWAIGRIAEEAPEHLHLAPSTDLEARIVRAEDALNGIEHQAARIAAEAWRQEGE
jgi:hypothetical protein